MNVQVCIEALVLEGTEPADGDRIRLAVEAELSRLFVERGTPPAWGRGAAISHMDGGMIEMGGDTPPEPIGVRIARTVYEGFWQ